MAKTRTYQSRFYRDFTARDLIKTEICVKETDLLILSDKKLGRDFLKEKIIFYRRQIEDYFKKDKLFKVSLKPVKALLDSPNIIKDMIEASSKANVGPMAAIAGAIAQYLGKDLLEFCNEIIIENGGDIFLKIKKERHIGIYAGKSIFSGKLFLKIKPEDNISGICSSSGTVGHSLSFGNADCVIILANSSILADSIATATANLVKNKSDTLKAINFAKNIDGVKGVCVIIDDILSSWGKIEFIN